jgi:hypothetical protein
MILRCPSCAQKFKVELSCPPRYCPLCGYDSAEDEQKNQERMVKMLDAQNPPHLSKTIGAVADKVYRDIENSSLVRQQMAAGAAGVPLAEMDAMKVTNLRDNLRPGDTAFVPAATPEFRANMTNAGAAVGYTRDPAIETYRAGAAAGPHALSGRSSMATAQSQFFNRTPDHFDGVRR